MEPGDIVYGPYPVTTNDRRKMNHYCLVLETKGDGMIRLALGTSSHIDSSPRDWEVLICAPDEIDELGLRKPTRFDLTENRWLPLFGFYWHATIMGNEKIVRRVVKAWHMAGLTLEGGGE